MILLVCVSVTAGGWGPTAVRGAHLEHLVWTVCLSVHVCTAVNLVTM